MLVLAGFAGKVEVPPRPPKPPEPPKPNVLLGSVASFKLDAPEDDRDGTVNDRTPGRVLAPEVVVSAGCFADVASVVVVVCATGVVVVFVAVVEPSDPNIEGLASVVVEIGAVVVVVVVVDGVVRLDPRLKPELRPSVGLTSVEPVAGVVVAGLESPPAPKLEPVEG